MAAELTTLVERQLVRVLDLVLLRKEPDGSVETAELADVDDGDVGVLRALEADLAMLLAEADGERTCGSKGCDRRTGRADGSGCRNRGGRQARSRPARRSPRSA